MIFKWRWWGRVCNDRILFCVFWYFFNMGCCEQMTNIQNVVFKDCCRWSIACHCIIIMIFLLTVSSMQHHSSEVARLYQTEFIRSARAVGVLWAVCTLCFAVIEVVILIQPSWVGTRELHYRGGGPAPPTGTLGLFEVCMETDWPVPECRGSLHTLTPLPAFQSPAVLVCMSLTMVWASVGCLCLFRFCNAATVYKICAWLQLTAGETLPLISH